MKKVKQKDLFGSICMLAAFLLWTVSVRLIDVQAIGPKGSTVGFAAVNEYIHDLTGVHMLLYTVTDWLSLVPLGFVIGFAVMGLIQWVKRKHILNVDHSVLSLGGFYILVMAVYLLFEVVVINYRPVLIDGHLEASYPSSTTMLVVCVMSTSAIQINARIKNNAVKRIVSVAITVFVLFMVTGRLVSGVHWFSDIVGGVLLSLGLVLLYRFVANFKIATQQNG